MKSLLDKAPKKLLDSLRKVSKISDQLGYSSYLVGGGVRDLILGRDVLDCDCVIVGDALKVARYLASESKAQLKIHKSFGTATLIFSNAQNVDLSTARSETYSRSGALPKVKQGVLRGDLLRRDFTINALALGLSKNEYGILQDECDGLIDLKKGVIRVLHSKSFLDDPTRIFRAVRFEKRFGFRIDRSTLLLLKEAIEQNVLDQVSFQRSCVELKKVLQENKPVQVLERLKSLGVLDFFEGFSKIPWQKLSYIEKNQNVFLKIGRDVHLERPLYFFYLMAMLQHSSEEAVTQFSQGLSCSKLWRKSFLQISEVSDIIAALRRNGLDRAKCYRYLKVYPDDVLVYAMVMAEDQKVRRRISLYLLEDRGSSLKITGRDVQKLGVGSGRNIRGYLDCVLDAKINQKFKSRSQELAFLKGIIKDSL